MLLSVMKYAFRNGTCVKSSENWKAELCGCGNGSYYKGSASKLELTMMMEARKCLKRLILQHL